jgi:hypothetical protein
MVWPRNETNFETTTLAALIIGAVLSALLAVGLMGLVFYSHRSDHDRQVQDNDPLDGPR